MAVAYAPNAIGGGSDVRFRATGIDGKAAAATLIGTPLRRFILDEIVVETTSVDTGSVAGAGSAGTNGADYNNLLAITTLTGLLTTDQVVRIPITAVAIVVPAGTGMHWKQTTGITATTAIIAVEFVGHYE